MQRLLLTLVCATVLAGCGDAGRDRAVTLEKRLESGDATAISELKKQAPDNPWAALALGRAQQLGIGTEVDLPSAMYSYSLAQKIPGAWFNAGLIYSQYLIRGLRPDGTGEPANACFKPSAKSSWMKAVDCFSFAANYPRPIQARIALGKMYEEGQQDLPRNPAKACLWFAKAADEHDDEGRFRYGMCLLSGNGVAQDIRTGTYLLLEAAKDYHVDAIRTLARLSERGGDKPKTGFWMLLLNKVDPGSKAETRHYLAGLTHEETMHARAQLDTWLLANRPPPGFGSGITAVLPISVADLIK